MTSLTSKLLLKWLPLFICLQASNAFLPVIAPTFEVVEESAPGTLIPGVADYLKRIALLSIETPDFTTFELMGMDAFTKSFGINSKSGELRTIVRIDRESICGSGVTSRVDLVNESNCLKHLNVLIKSYEKGGTLRGSLRQTITLRTIDINDNAPRWPGKQQLTVRFFEDFQSGSGYGNLKMTSQFQLLEMAIDPDFGPNGTISYSLNGIGADVFLLEYYNLENSRFEYQDTAGSLRLKLVAPLDREAVAFYNLTLCAYDAGNPPRSSSIPLNVYVTDANDHAPVFHSHVSGHILAFPQDNRPEELVKYVPERGHLTETARVGSAVLQLNATDDDAEENARITYSIFPSDVALIQAYFTLDPTSGYLTVKQRLDYDSGPRRFTFKVLAVDGAPEPYQLTGTATVDIELTDFNDEPPIIEILIAQNGASNSITNGGITHTIPHGSVHQELVAYIEESPSPDLVIAYVQVSDKDENGEDQVECHLGAKDNFTLQADSFSSVSRTNHFSIATALLADRRVSEYQILAKVPSGGDHLTGDTSNLQNHLDRETTPSQLITVICNDRNRNQNERQIRLYLLDINDNPPRFLNNSNFNFSLFENQEPVGKQKVWLGRVQAVDVDLGENARITYHLAPHQTSSLEAHYSPSPQELFHVQPDTGDIYAQVSLDRENAPEGGVYSFTVLAMDHGKPQQLTSTARVEVTVLDVNDWPPEFTRDSYNFEVREDLDIGGKVGVVKAFDRDAASGANTITYHLSPPRPASIQRSLKNETGKKRVKRDLVMPQQQPQFTPHLEPSKARDEGPLSYFSIDARSGELQVIRKLDRESNGYFTFEVLAIDGPLVGLPSQAPSMPAQSQQTPNRGYKGGEVFTATATVVVTITDVNDNEPEFRYPNASILLYMVPGETLGHRILTVQATDADYGENARISYSISSDTLIPQYVSGSGNFAIDDTSGLIFLTRPIQGPVNHRLIIKACDHGVRPKCKSSPTIQIVVSEDSKLVGSSSSGISSADSSVHGLGRAINGGDRSAVSSSDHRFNNIDGFYSSYYDQRPPQRVEVIAACLVVVLGVLLLAVVLVCLLKRRTFVNGQPRINNQTQQNQGSFDYICTLLWNCKWPFFRHQKCLNTNPSTAPAKRSAQHYTPEQIQEVLNDQRFLDGQSAGSSGAKGVIYAESTTDSLEDEKKPLYYEGFRVLEMDATAARGLRHPVAYSTGEADGSGARRPNPFLFTGNPSCIYGAVPAVSTILSDCRTTINTIGYEFQPTADDRGHPGSITPPSPEYQSLDQFAGRSLWQTGPRKCVDPFAGTPGATHPLNSKNSSSTTARYGCLIDSPCISTSCLKNYYEVSSNGICYPRQRNAIMERLIAMTQEETESVESVKAEPIGTTKRGTGRLYSQLEATDGVEREEEDRLERDRPTSYTYQAIREASFV